MGGVGEEGKAIGEEAADGLDEEEATGEEEDELEAPYTCVGSRMGMTFVHYCIS
jgi:hypothetical protein